jgi:uncharacterized protein
MSLTSNSLGRWSTLGGLCIALLAPVLPPLVGSLAGWSEFSAARLGWGVVVHWLIFAAIVAWVILLERRDLASIGVRPLRWWTLPLGLVAGTLIIGVAGSLIAALHLSSDTRFAGYLLSQSWPVRLLLVITAGVFEETAYRGYALERLTPVLGSKWLAAGVTVLCFAFSHIPAVGLSHVLPVLIVSIPVTLLYLWRRDLVLNMVAHATVDAISLLVVPAIGGS